MTGPRGLSGEGQTTAAIASTTTSAYLQRGHAVDARRLGIRDSRPGGVPVMRDSTRDAAGAVRAANPAGYPTRGSPAAQQAASVWQRSSRVSVVCSHARVLALRNL